MYLLNSRGNYRGVSSVKTADFAATLDRSNNPNSAQVLASGPRGLNGLKFAPNQANQTHGGINVSFLIRFHFSSPVLRILKLMPIFLDVRLLTRQAKAFMSLGIRTL